MLLILKKAVVVVISIGALSACTFIAAVFSKFPANHTKIEVVSDFRNMGFDLVDGDLSDCLKSSRCIFKHEKTNHMSATLIFENDFPSEIKIVEIGPTKFSGPNQKVVCELTNKLSDIYNLQWNGDLIDSCHSK